MNLFKNSALSACGCNYCSPQTLGDRNPDPLRWHLLDRRQIGEFLAIKLKYPNCTNFEGEKILVFHTRWEQLRRQTAIDPHFGESNLIYPIARFRPTAEGWQDALNFAESKHVANTPTVP